MRCAPNCGSSVTRTTTLLTALLFIANIEFVELHRPGGQAIYINPAEVTSIRQPTVPGHFSNGTNCLIYLTNRNFITVTETCSDVIKRVFDNQHKGGP